MWQRVEETLIEVLRAPAAARSQVLEASCGDDGELRREVESLLAAADDAEGFLAAPAFSLHAGVAAGPGVGQLIGPYRLERLIGRGGMGAVYLARRTGGEDDRREALERVALKLMKPGLETGEIVRRFREERRILAFLDHPNIARLLDGGTTRDGLPYFVMDYVEGEHIDRYCDRHELRLHRRIPLFLSVCSAVHFAHQNRVVHRDLKPGNILVGADGEPRLLDFGIAKLLDALPSHLSALGIQLMTLEYASPEQIRGGAVTVASDVYSLGVILYELLSGRHPHRTPRRRAAELCMAIRDEEPERPSVAVQRAERSARDGAPLTPTPESVGRARGTDPGTLARRLAGDLDRIVLRTLEKWPRNRYASVPELAGDLRRYLEGH